LLFALLTAKRVLRFSEGNDKMKKISQSIRLGASSMALFARVGGGVFTKAADVGADLVGKVEAGIPEDDPRNPAVIADNVGDNVGDVAGMGADLYESYVGSVISASALGVAAFGGDIKAIALPLILASLGVLCSILGTFLVRTKEGASQTQLLRSLSTGTNFSAILIALLSLPLVWLVLGQWKFYFAILAGLLAGVLIGQATEYFTSETYNPTRKLSAAAETGSATTIISGFSLGMLSTALPVIIIAIAVLIAYFVSGGAEAVSGANLSLMNPTVLIGLFIGACLPFVFAALVLNFNLISLF